MFARRHAEDRVTIGMSAETDPPAIPVTKVRPRTMRIEGECTM
jgi:hypothetical protein